MPDTANSVFKRAKRITNDVTTMVMQSKKNDRAVYQCEFCDMGYADLNPAQRCEEWCSTHDSCSLEVTRKAIYKPTLDFMPS